MRSYVADNDINVMNLPKSKGLPGNMRKEKKLEIKEPRIAPVIMCHHCDRDIPVEENYKNSALNELKEKDYKWSNEFCDDYCLGDWVKKKLPF